MTNRSYEASSDAKPYIADRLLIVHKYPTNARPGRSVVAPLDHAINGARCSLECSFNPSVAEVANPPGHVDAAREFARVVAEENALDLTRDVHDLTHARPIVRTRDGFALERRTRQIWQLSQKNVERPFTF